MLIAQFDEEQAQTSTQTKVSEIKEEPCDETEELTIEMLKALPKLEKKAILKRLKKLIKKKKI